MATGSTTPRWIAEERKRNAALQREFARSPVGDLIGVVSPLGVSGGKSQGEKRWTMQVWLLAWRLGGGPVQHDELVATQQTGVPTINKTQESLGGYAVVRMRVRLASTVWQGKRQARIVKLLGRSRDRQMLAEAERLRKPVRFKDPTVGTCTLDRASGDFVARVTWNRRRVALSLRSDPGGSPAKSLAHAKKLFSKQREIEQRIRHVLGTTSYRLWLGSWREEGDRLLSRDVFVARPRLDAITIEPSGAFQFWFDDRGMFWGHGVVVRGTTKTMTMRASLEG